MGKKVIEIERKKRKKRQKTDGALAQDWAGFRGSIEEKKHRFEAEKRRKKIR